MRGDLSRRAFMGTVASGVAASTGHKETVLQCSIYAFDSQAVKSAWGFPEGVIC